MAKDRVCPFKFNQNTLDTNGDTQKDTCLCERDNCQFWTSANTTEGNAIYDCAITLMGMSGRIIV